MQSIEQVEAVLTLRRHHPVNHFSMDEGHCYPSIVSMAEQRTKREKKDGGTTANKKAEAWPRFYGCAPPPGWVPSVAVDESDNGVLSSARIKEHGVKSCEPAVTVISTEKKGFCAIANRPIGVGEIVLMDHSELSIPTDAALYFSVNAPQRCVMADVMSGNSSAASATSATSLHRRDVSRFYEEEESAILADCAVIVRKAQVLYGSSLLESRALQTILALLVQYGDTLLLYSASRARVALPPRNKAKSLQQPHHETAGDQSMPKPIAVERKKSSENTPTAAAPPDTLARFTTEMQLRSDRAGAMVRSWLSEWCSHADVALPPVEDEDPGHKARRLAEEREWLASRAAERRRTADAVLSCIPEEYFMLGADEEEETPGDGESFDSSSSDEDTGSSSGEDGTRASAPQERKRNRKTRDEGRQGSLLKMGFLARVGLDNADALCQLFAVLDCNSVEVDIPSIPSRLGMFPFLRYLEHECRPNCVVGYLDCPATHNEGRVSQTDEALVNPADPYEDSDKKKEDPKKKKKLYDHHQYSSRQVFAPSTVMVTAMRPIAAGEFLSISYVPATYMTQPDRQQRLREQYRFNCVCRWCTTEPDLPRAFRCPRCEENKTPAAMCPVGDGHKYDLWCCLQCGYHPDMEYINRCLDAERLLGRLDRSQTNKAMYELISNEYVHFTHSVVFRKADEWAEKSWVAQEANLCLNYIETLIQCANRVLQEHDPSKAQYHEFNGQLQHALGNAHTARAEYQTALRIREAAGQELTYWAARTRFMAVEKKITEFMDSK